MIYFLVGLGNPGDEYFGTRHNVGRDLVGYLRNNDNLSNIKFYVLDEYMNNSGKAVVKIMVGKKASQLVLIHDDIDLPLGIFKLSFNKGAGGHRGVASVIKALKTEEFIRVRVGVSPTTLKGIIRKPCGEDKVVKFILGKFKPGENKIIAVVRKKINQALSVLVKEGKEKAMSLVY